MPAGAMPTELIVGYLSRKLPSSPIQLHTLDRLLRCDFFFEKSTQPLELPNCWKKYTIVQFVQLHNSTFTQKSAEADPTRSIARIFECHLLSTDLAFSFVLGISQVLEDRRVLSIL